MTKYFITLNSFASSCFRGFSKKTLKARHLAWPWATTVRW